MSKIKIELDHATVRSFLQCDEIKEMIEEAAQQVAQAATGKHSDTSKEHYSVKAEVGRKRAWTKVKAETPQALHNCFSKNELLKALHSIGGGR